MKLSNKKIVTDEQSRLVAVLIDYEDWKRIEQLLVAHQGEETAKADNNQEPQLEVKFALQVGDTPEAHRQEAESKAKKPM